MRCLATACQRCLRATRAASYLSGMSRRTSVFLLVVLALVGCSPRTTFGVWADAVTGRLQAEGGPTRVLPWWAQPR
jgi:hypothetical protein